jgi:hypothetical protein
MPGIVRSVDGGDRARRIPGVAEVFMRTGPGGRVVFPRNNVEKCGNVITACDTRPAAVEAAQRAIGEICLRLEPLDAHSDEFLFGIGTDAFTLGRADNKGAVASMPAWQGEASRVGTDPTLLVMPLPSLALEACEDWHGMNLQEAVDRSLRVCAMRWATGLFARGGLVLGSLFWRVLLRGSTQGALYLADSLRAAARQGGLGEYLRRICG